MLEEFLARIWTTWRMGGWTMIPLCVLSLLIYGQAVRLLIFFSGRDFSQVTDDALREWVRAPEEVRGEVGEIVQYTQAGVESAADIHHRFSEVMKARLPVLERRQVFLSILITAAPLLGLLGTVYGMLMTFSALATGGGQLTEQMAAGISQALFPPEVGLCVALPGLLLVQIIKRKRQEYAAFLARLESLTIQQFRTGRMRGTPPARVRTEPIMAPALIPQQA